MRMELKLELSSAAQAESIDFCLTLCTLSYIKYVYCYTCEAFALGLFADELCNKTDLPYTPSTTLKRYRNDKLVTKRFWCMHTQVFKLIGAKKLMSP